MATSAGHLAWTSHRCRARRRRECWRWHRSVPGARGKLYPRVVSADVLPEPLHRQARSAFGHRLPDDSLQWGSDHVEVVEDRVHPWFVQDGTAHHRGVAGQHPEREVPAAARSEDRQRADRQRIDQGRRIIGLLLGRRRRPPCRSRTPAVPTPVVSDDRELVGQQIGERVEMTAVAGRPHDQKNRRTAAADLVVELGTVDADHRHRKAAGILDMPLLGQIRAATAGHVIVRYP